MFTPNFRTSHPLSGLHSQTSARWWRQKTRQTFFLSLSWSKTRVGHNVQKPNFKQKWKRDSSTARGTIYEQTRICYCLIPNKKPKVMISSTHKDTPDWPPPPQIPASQLRPHAGNNAEQLIKNLSMIWALVSDRGQYFLLEKYWHVGISHITTKRCILCLIPCTKSSSALLCNAASLCFILRSCVFVHPKVHTTSRSASGQKHILSVIVW